MSKKYNDIINIYNNRLDQNINNAEKILSTLNDVRDKALTEYELKTNYVKVHDEHGCDIERKGQIKIEKCSSDVGMPFEMSLKLDDITPSFTVAPSTSLTAYCFIRILKDETIEISFDGENWYEDIDSIFSAFDAIVKMKAVTHYSVKF